MALAKRYDGKAEEPAIAAFWKEQGVYEFDRESDAPIYAIDTPPPTVSGFLHLGHVYSYSHPDFQARFRRMRGDNVFYPMGYDDNGLPTERLVERRYHVTAPQVGRQAFIDKCLAISEEIEGDYQALWQRLGLSVDWRYSYRTIDDLSRRTSQLSFVELYKAGRAYRQQAPAIWCPECRTAIAQAEVNDLDRGSVFYTLAFRLENGDTLPIATTRPELLPACVAVFVNPADARYTGLIGQRVRVPLFDLDVPLLADPLADPAKGTGAVMCCTFGDTTDVDWWHTHDLPLRIVIGREGRLTERAGQFAGLPIAEARKAIVGALAAAGLLLGQEEITQTVRVHERCDTPVEYIVIPQWFIRVLDRKEELLAAGEAITWHPEHMKARYLGWVENLRWDWCISRQRYFGVPIPVWYCAACGDALAADPDQLPVDPTKTAPPRACACGSTRFTPEEDVMDTWATSSMSPQIVGQWLQDPALYARVFPMALRPQAHEIIRTWAFYTIVKSLYHFGTVPWKEVLISGWGLAPEGAGKISKSRGGGPMPPQEMIELYSADAVRYWAASTGPGRDSVISEEKMRVGAKLVTKLWNVARFAETFLADYRPPATPPALAPTDRWILSRAQRLIARVTGLLEDAEYATAKSEIEAFFWRDLADNYLEMAKGRLYEAAHPARDAARYTLYTLVQTVVKLFAPFLPYVTEAIYQGLFAPVEAAGSIHRARWPVADPALLDEAAEAAGEALVDVATAVRRYKSEAGLSVGADLARLHLGVPDAAQAALLRAAETDLRSVTRAQAISFGADGAPGLTAIPAEGAITVLLAPTRRVTDDER